MNMNEKICTFCAKTIGDDIHTIGEDFKHAIDKLLLKLNLNTSKEIMICNQCMHELQVYIDFKMACACMRYGTPQIIVINDVSMGIIDIENTNNLKPVVDSQDRIRCCFCKEPTKRKDLISINQKKKNVSIVNMLKECMELNLNNIERILTCKTCLDSLQGLFKFIMNCFDIQEKRSKHIKVEMDGVNEIELKSVQQFTCKPTVKSESGCFYKKEIKAKYDDIQDGVVIKVERQIKNEQVDNQELNVKTGNIGIKSDPDNCNNFQELPGQTSLENDKKSLFHCKICAFNTSCKIDLRNHLSTHLIPSAITYKCELCPYVTKYNWDFNFHVQSHKNSSDTTIYKCKTCTFETNRKNSYEVHKLTHVDSEAKIYKYEICTYEANYLRYKKKRILKNTSPAIAYKCDVCTYKSRSKSYLGKHMLRHVNLSDTKLYICDICLFDTRCQTNIKRHMLTHVKSTCTIYKCKLCTYETGNSENITQHVISEHNKPKSKRRKFKCDACPFESIFKKKLEKHMTKHINPSKNQTCKSEMCSFKIVHTNSKVEIVYKCEVCEFCTNNRDNFHQHVLGHKSPSVADKYKCFQCSFETTCQDLLKQHELTHPEVYKCSICAHETMKEDNHKRHLLIHA